MAITIMGGLTVGSFLTMILLPVFYAIFYNVESVPGQQPVGDAMARA